MHRRKTLAGMAIAIASAAIALAGCSSSSSSGSGTAGSTAGSSAAATGAPIVIGNVGTYSGPIGASNTAAIPLIKEWVSQVNAAGGINGHPVQFVSADDQTSPSANLTAVESQVSNQHVIAFVGDMAEATVNSAQSFLESKSVPVIGGDGSLPTWYESPMYFPTGSSPSVLNTAQIQLVKTDGFKKLALWYCTDSPTCKIYANQEQAAAKSIGMTTTGLQPISLAQPNFTAACLSSKSAGADVLNPNVDPSTLQRVVASCESVGYNPTYLASTQAVDAAFQSLPSNVKATGVQQTFPFFASSGAPGIAAYQSMVKSFPTTELNAGTSQIWTAIQLFAAAAKAGVPQQGTPTSAEILKGLYTIHGDTLGGLTVPLSFTKGHSAPQGTCWFTYQFQGDKFVDSDLKPACGS
jgi:branched-chain amino acid transport system substrate-binding protein